ncbi:hypothetical protein HI914_04013 [Erysiphe necator]|nr:hypothetical protein HI914_04013 [Erysiphe necator]
MVRLGTKCYILETQKNPSSYQILLLNINSSRRPYASKRQITAILRQNNLIITHQTSKVKIFEILEWIKNC